MKLVNGGDIGESWGKGKNSWNLPSESQDKRRCINSDEMLGGMKAEEGARMCQGLFLHQGN